MSEYNILVEALQEMMAGETLYKSPKLDEVFVGLFCFLGTFVFFINQLTFIELSLAQPRNLRKTLHSKFWL
jgi:hypothetical protein